MKVNNLKATSIALSVATMAVVLTGCAGSPVARGVHGNDLGDCPGKPNCITTNSKDKDRSFPPFTFEGDRQKAKDKLVQVLKDYPRAEITRNEDNYLRVEFTTALFRFTDDAEFLILDDYIKVRSESRVGYSDLGKNRSRMEDIQEAFEPCCN